MADILESHHTLVIRSDFVVYAALEHFSSDCQVFLRKEDSHSAAFHDRACHHHAAGCLCVVTRYIGSVDYLIDETVFLIAVRNHSVDGFSEEVFEFTIVLVDLLVHDFHRIDQSDQPPAACSAPEVCRASCFLVSPGLNLRFVKSVVVEAFLFVEEVFPHVAELGHDVVVVFHLMESCFIFHVEGLCHVKAVEPDLIGVDVFVPEAAAFASRMCVKPLHMVLDCCFISFIACLVKSEEKELAACQIIECVLIFVVGRNASVRLHSAFEVVNDVVCVLSVAGGFEHPLASHQQAAVFVIPVSLIGLVVVQVSVQKSFNFACVHCVPLPLFAAFCV